jgi:hypothetical protein
MSSLANTRLQRPCLVVAMIGAFLTELAGCATAPRPSSNAPLSSVIGIAVISPSPSDLPHSVNSTRKLANDSSGSVFGVFKGFGSFGPGALLLIPFALGYEALRSAAQPAPSCEADLNFTYPGVAAGFHSAVQREFEPNDVLDGFTEPLRNHSSGEVVVIGSPTEKKDVPTTQQLLEIAAQRGVARLLVIEVLGAELADMDALCEHWAFRVDLRVSLWSVAERKRIGGPLLSSPYTTTSLSTLQAMIEESGAIRSRLAPNFGVAADDMFEHGQLLH